MNHFIPRSESFIKFASGNYYFRKLENENDILFFANAIEMTLDEAAQLTTDIGNIAADTVKQLNKLIVDPSMTDKFYLGLLIRERTILRDVAAILLNNNERHITSAFVLYRVLLDDFIRLFSVHAREKNREEEIIKIAADAHGHRFKNIDYSRLINDTYYLGKHPSLATQEIYDADKLYFLSSPDNDKFFEDKTKFKFKRLPRISDIFELMRKDVKTISNVHAYVLYKILTQHVHYSNLTYTLDNNPDSRKIEIDMIEEILLYAIKMLNIQFDFFLEKYPIKWNDSKVRDFFESKTIQV